jgi:hypothetical protein
VTNVRFILVGSFGIPGWCGTVQKEAFFRPIIAAVLESDVQRRINNLAVIENMAPPGCSTLGGNP